MSNNWRISAEEAGVSAFSGESGDAACPFCGNGREIKPIEDAPRWAGDTHRFYMRCKDCDAQGPRATSWEAMLNAWERRIYYRKTDKPSPSGLPQPAQGPA